MKTVPAKTILSQYSGDNPWFGSNYNMNLYRGCCHGCIYCDSRSDCYQIEDFDTVRIKENALEILERELKSKRRAGVVGTGAMSDPYNPFEKKHEYTRQALKLLLKHGFGAAIATKGDIITRDLEILKQINENAPVICKITITAASDSLSKMVEPNAPLSSSRFDTIERLSKAGIFSGVLLMPVLPFIEDSEENVLEIIKRTKECGGKFIYPSWGMTLRGNQKLYYYNKLDELFPGLKDKYIKNYGSSYSCRSTNSNNLKNIFQKECRKHGILYRMQDIVNGYKDNQNKQLSLF